MPFLNRKELLVLILALLWVIIGCNFISSSRKLISKSEETPASEDTPVSTTTSVASSSLEINRSFTICIPQEPASLFIYADNSAAARSIRAAINDGPFDSLNFEPVPVILEKKPTLKDQDLRFESTSVQPGDLIVDSHGQVLALNEGVSYLPAGCQVPSCAVTYAGQVPIQMDQLVAQFRLLSGLKWSDGTPLTADDSLYSFEVAKALYPRARPDLVAITSKYEVLDERALEWRSLPGYKRANTTDLFFTPLPRHAWGSVPPEDLENYEPANRSPVGWGAYMIEEWSEGKQVSLVKNPGYFRANEGLPTFDKVVFRFIPDAIQALAEVQAGRCDLLDEQYQLDPSAVKELAAAKKIAAFNIPGTAWAHLDFGINSLEPSLPAFFQAKEVRQAVAFCTDRQKLVEALALGQSQVLESYIPASHPLFNSEIKKYPFNPDSGKSLLDAAGWKDLDGDTATPRTAQGIANIPDGTPFELKLLNPDETQNTQVASIIQESLAQCGIKININSMPLESFYEPGPGGTLFGRKFSLAQFSWAESVEPPCFLYTSEQIPGAYPSHPNGWGGGNIAGYSNPAYDQACWQVLNSQPEQPEYATSHAQAQAIFSEDIPALPLYILPRQIVARPDICGIQTDIHTTSYLWNLESLNYGSGCKP